MNRFIYCLAWMLLSGLVAFSQQTPASTTRANEFYRNGQLTAIDTVDTIIENRLVELALKNPSYDVSKHQIRINELQLKKVKNSWLNLLTISTNYNDQSFTKSAANTTYVYPKYFFGVTIPLGLIFSQGNDIKIARESAASSKAQQEVLARSIKADVLSKYKSYKLYRELIKIQSELINDVIANATQAEDSFKKGGISVEAYIVALKSKNDELAKHLNLKLQQDLIEIEIEEIIGVPLEDVLHPTTTPPSGR